MGYPPEPSNLQVFKLNPTAILPTRAYSDDAGFDLYAIEDIIIRVPTITIGTGLAIKIPQGYVGKIECRGSMAVKGFNVTGGIIDASYCGEIKVNLQYRGEMGYKINKGDKIAQIVIGPIILPNIVEVNQLWDSERGNKGFGSSGA